MQSKIRAALSMLVMIVMTISLPLSVSAQTSAEAQNEGRETPATYQLAERAKVTLSVDGAAVADGSTIQHAYGTLPIKLEWSFPDGENCRFQAGDQFTYDLPSNLKLTEAEGELM